MFLRRLQLRDQEKRAKAVNDAIKPFVRYHCRKYLFGNFPQSIEEIIYQLTFESLGYTTVAEIKRRKIWRKAMNLKNYCDELFIKILFIASDTLSIIAATDKNKCNISDDMSTINPTFKDQTSINQLKKIFSNHSDKTKSLMEALENVSIFGEKFEKYHKVTRFESSLKHQLQNYTGDSCNNIFWIGYFKTQYGPLRILVICNVSKWIGMYGVFEFYSTCWDGDTCTGIDHDERFDDDMMTATNNIVSFLKQLIQVNQENSTISKQVKQVATVAIEYNCFVNNCDDNDNGNDNGDNGDNGNVILLKDVLFNDTIGNIKYKIYAQNSKYHIGKSRLYYKNIEMVDNESSLYEFFRLNNLESDDMYKSRSFRFKLNPIQVICNLVKDDCIFDYLVSHNNYPDRILHGITLDQIDDITFYNTVQNISRSYIINKIKSRFVNSNHQTAHGQTQTQESQESQESQIKITITSINNEVPNFFNNNNGCINFDYYELAMDNSNNINNGRRLLIQFKTNIVQYTAINDGDPNEHLKLHWYSYDKGKMALLRINGYLNYQLLLSSRFYNNFAVATTGKRIIRRQFKTQILNIDNDSIHPSIRYITNTIRIRVHLGFFLDNINDNSNNYTHSDEQKTKDLDDVDVEIDLFTKSSDDKEIITKSFVIKDVISNIKKLIKGLSVYKKITNISNWNNNIPFEFFANMNDKRLITAANINNIVKHGSIVYCKSCAIKVRINFVCNNNGNGDDMNDSKSNFDDHDHDNVYYASTTWSLNSLLTNIINDNRIKNKIDTIWQIVEIAYAYDHDKNNKEKSILMTSAILSDGKSNLKQYGIVNNCCLTIKYQEKKKIVCFKGIINDELQNIDNTDYMETGKLLYDKNDSKSLEIDFTTTFYDLKTLICKIFQKEKKDLLSIHLKLTNNETRGTKKETEKEKEKEKDGNVNHADDDNDTSIFLQLDITMMKTMLQLTIDQQVTILVAHFKK